MSVAGSATYVPPDSFPLSLWCLWPSHPLEPRSPLRRKFLVTKNVDKSMLLSPWSRSAEGIGRTEKFFRCHAQGRITHPAARCRSVAGSRPSRYVRKQ